MWDTLEYPDDVILGPRAAAWHDVIGPYGDPLRMVLVNWLVASALNHFGGEAGQGRIAKPHRLIRDCIASRQVSETVPLEAQIPDFVHAHEDVRKLNLQYPSLAGTRLLDLGSGNSYIGGWLAALGVQYTGVEPSADLMRAARADPRLAGATLIESTIRRYCESDLHPQADPPTLISIIGVVDHLGDPEASFRSLFGFLERRKWLNVPIVVAAFDPDYFLSELPVEDVMQETSAPYGVTETLKVRDPAAWEELFVSTGFHVIEQRPLHISSLPDGLSAHLQNLHKRLFEGDGDDSVGFSPEDGQWSGKARVPPRQGPFYFWLLTPRNVIVERHIDPPAGEAVPGASQIERFDQEEMLSVVGNLSPRIYRLIEGDAVFESSETGRMGFRNNITFGQLEASSNYVSSRVLGTLAASAGSRLEVVESREILRYLEGSERYPDKLFLSLLHHLESVQFIPFVSAKRMDERRSMVLTGGSYNWRFVRNIAACLLQACANSVRNPVSCAFRSRIFIDLSEEAICKFIYGPEFKREGPEMIKIIPALVQANVIDSFSAYLLERSSAEDTLSEIGDVDKDTYSPSNLGWQVARFIDHQFARPDAGGLKDDIYPLALAIAAFFGSTDGRDTFKSEFSQLNRSEERNKKAVGGPGRAATLSRPKTDKERCDYVLSLVECAEDQHDRLRHFLTLLHQAFDYNEPRNFARKFGLSRFMVVRDIWALIACLLDREDMWVSSTRVVQPTSYMAQGKQNPRIVAYLQECVAHAGRQAGFERCPW
ncbi:MAG: class I SAM-dependent methyltransferase [Allosphingosinicella sp.]